MITATPMFRGSCAALITPFTEQGAIDTFALERLIAMQIKNNCGALLLCGTTGEGASLSPEERREMILLAKSVRATMGSSVPILVGCGTSCTVSSCEQAKNAAKSGADALLVLTPPYVKATEEGLCSHLRAMHAESNLPMLLYHVPSRTGMTLTLAHLESVASACDFVTGIKEASGDLTLISRIREHFGDRFSLYCGSDEINFPALCLGCEGLISVLAVPCPRLTEEICRLTREGKIDEAKRMHYLSQPLVRELFLRVNPVMVKGLMARRGYCSERIRLPLTGAKSSLIDRIDLILGEVLQSFDSL